MGWVARPASYEEAEAKDNLESVEGYYTGMKWSKSEDDDKEEPMIPPASVITPGVSAPLRIKSEMFLNVPTSVIKRLD
jgi:hypothetical protein